LREAHLGRRVVVIWMSQEARHETWFGSIVT
jgi:hypothetical protein